MKPLCELINSEEPGWDLITEWLADATNHVEVLPCTTEAGETALYQSQVTSRSPMGAVAYQSGGLLVDHGWIRVFGAGCDRLPISMPAWNKGKTLREYGQGARFWIIGDDVLGGIFALNGGQFGDDLGNVYYYPMDALEWEPMELGYSDFLWWCFTGNLEQFYEGFRWQGWKDEVAVLPGDRVFFFYPFLSCEAKSLESRDRKTVPVDESYGLFVGEIH